MLKRRRAKSKGIQLIQGRLRTILAVAGIGFALLLLILLLRPTQQLINSPEIARTKRLGVLRVGVRTDVPGFAYGGEGLEVSLARALCGRIFPGMDTGIALELIPVTQHTALAKLDDGTIDITFALQQDQNSTSYTYSTPYYTDTVCVLCRPEDVNTPLEGRTVGLVASSESNAKSKLETLNQRGELTLTPAHYGSYPDLANLLKNRTIDFFIAPGVFVPSLLQEGGIALHSYALGGIGYVAVSTADQPAFAMLAGLMIDDLHASGQLDRWIDEYGLTAYQYHNTQ